ncbi:COX15/CtaA family protein [Meiothermus sp. CFH 77666]|nr:COX15/CtaA family protein [Meiothermus sp. CFH 77666]
MNNRRFTFYAWGVVIFTLVVILWGDVVQATGSGDGCGAHWPTCNGEVLPAFRGLETFIEFFHRITSGLSLLLTIGLLVWSRRTFPQGHLVRLGAALSMFFMITESLVGAGLVLFRLVGADASIARAVIAPIHLINTLFLIGSLALTAWWSSHPDHRPVWKGQGWVGWALGLGFMGILGVAASGALTSLGDTLFPVRNTAEAVGRALTPGEHFLVQLRIYHPFIAVMVSVYMVLIANLVATLRPSIYTRWFARAAGVVFILQLGMGYLNVQQLAPLYTQLPHLLLSDVIWVTWLLLTVSALSLAYHAPSARIPAPEAR